MVRLYLDVETYRENIAFDEKVIAIGFIEDWTPYREDQPKQGIKAKIFGEWDLGDEHSVIKSFYEYFEELTKKARTIIVIGFMILRYDIPLLIQKGIEYKIASPAHLNNIWHTTFIIDYTQVMLPAYGFKFKGNSLENLANEAKLRGCQVQPLYGKGKDVNEWYNKENYEEIEKHLRRDVEVLREIDLSGVIYKILKNKLITDYVE